MLCTKFWPNIEEEKNTPDAAKDATSVTFFNVGKTYACLVHQDYYIEVFAKSTTHRNLPLCVVQRCSHYHIKETTNIQSKNIEARSNKFLSWLKVWLLGG